MRTDIYTRFLTYSILKQVIFSGRPLNSAFEKSVASVLLSASDKAFIRALVSVCLRRYGQIQAILNHLIQKPLPKKLNDVFLALVIGIGSYCFLKVPAHAAVDTTVELVRYLKKTGLTRFVNGVLRHLTDANTPWQEWIHEKMLLPEWLYQRLNMVYGQEKTNALLQAYLMEPKLNITVREKPALWAERLKGQILPTGSIQIDNTSDLQNLPGFQEGAWWVQNAAAAIPARLIRNIQGKKIIDLCAAPGGKTVQLAVSGAYVTACDISAARLVRLRENIHRLNLEKQVKIVVGDTQTLPEDEVFDAVLLDAPCSATGTFRRNPDVVLHRQPEDIVRLAEMQKKLLRKAVRLVREGGEIIYAVCSLLPEEGEAVIQTVLQENKSVYLDAISESPFSSFMTSQGYLRTFPDEGLDGFFVARLIKKTNQIMQDAS